MAGYLLGGIRYQQSRQGVWHVVGASVSGLNLPVCQDWKSVRGLGPDFNYLRGPVVDELPPGESVCRKCCRALRIPIGGRS